jgi:hypothetical protein
LMAAPGHFDRSSRFGLAGDVRFVPKATLDFASVVSG